MIKQPTNAGKDNILVFLLAVTIALFLGCYSHKAADVKPSESKQITGIFINENSKSLVFTIRGNQSLTFTANKQVDPKGILFQFPDTKLGDIKRAFSPADNDIISSVHADEIVEGKSITSNIFITFKRDTPYDLIPNDDGIMVSFPRSIARSQEIKPQKESAEKKPEPKPVQIMPEPEPAQKKPESKPTQISVASATRIKVVTAKPLENKVIVNVSADGTIKDFKSFTMENPARIVFDMFNVKSPYKEEQKIAVESKLLKQIRYFGYPHKVRLVLDTHKDYLTKYSPLSADTGLLIHIGDIPAAPIKASQTKKDESLENKQVTLRWGNVPNATSYNIYLSNSPGVTKRNGIKISNVKSPYTVENLKQGTTYYFTITAVNESGESNESEESSHTVGK